MVHNTHAVPLSKSERFSKEFTAFIASQFFQLPFYFLSGAKSNDPLSPVCMCHLHVFGDNKSSVKRRLLDERCGHIQ